MAQIHSRLLRGLLLTSIAALAACSGTFGASPTQTESGASPDPGFTSATGATLPPDPASTALPDVAPSALQATLNSVVVQTGESQSLVQYLRDENGNVPTQGLVWSTNDGSVATVDQNGQVHGLGQGVAIVTVRSSASSAPATTFTVNVVEKRTVSLIQVSPDTPTMHVGDKLQLSAKVQLADGEINGNVSWSSSDGTIAAVAQDGTVSALKPGTVTIRAAYTPDSRYVGLSEVAIVAASASIPPSPTPTPVVFGPGATPLPSASPVPTPTPSDSGYSEWTPTPTPTPWPTSTPSPSGHWLVQASGTSVNLWGLCFLNKTTGFVVGDRTNLPYPVV